MDSFTQILLGIATAEVVAGNQLKNKTFLYGAILGTIPDLDIVVGLFMDPVSGVAIHRGLSHSLLFFAVLAPILGWVITKLERGKIKLQRAIILAFFGLFTHVVLDAFTSWGTQILWPLPKRFALKTIFVIDPLYTIPLLIALIYVFRTKTKHLRRTYVLRGIGISSMYLLLSCGLKLVALHQFENALHQQNITFTEIIVKPTAFNTLLWNANVAVSEGYLIADYSFFDSQPIQFKSYKTNTKAQKAISESTYFKQLVLISEDWYIVTKHNNTIYFNDLRFGLLNTNPKQPQFAFSYAFNANPDGTYTVVEVPKLKREGKVLVQNLWKRLLGN